MGEPSACDDPATGYAQADLMAKGHAVPKILIPRCYVCGTPVEFVFTLAALSQDVDRVFIAHTSCSQEMSTMDLHTREVRARA